LSGKKKHKRISEPRTSSAKYIFLDIVGFTHQRSVEAQTDIVAALNSVVKASVKRIDEKNLILLPTGDGICIVLLDIESPYDVHMQIALDIVKRVFQHSRKAKDDPMRQFQVRLGVNANVDNVVTDINGRRNIAWAGINLAQRVMSSADGNQILVGGPVFETLVYREKYLHAFRAYTAPIKHGAQLAVHQYVAGNHEGLNVNIPSQFLSIVTPEKELTKLAAYYFAHAMNKRGFIKQKVDFGNEPYTIEMLLYFLAMDSCGTSEASDISPYKPQVWGAGSRTLDEQYKYYESLDFWVKELASSLLLDQYLSAYREYFEQEVLYGFSWHFITKEGEQKLKKEWPSIWTDFDLDKASKTVLP